MNTSVIKAVLVDFDGTLVDTKLANAQAYQSSLSKIGFSMTVDEVAASINGRHYSVFLPEILGEKYSSELSQKIIDFKRNIYSKFFFLIKLNLGLFKLLNNIRKNNCKVVIVSNSSRESILSILDYLGIGDFFELIICGDDIDDPKPSPLCYMYALKKTGLNPEQCLAFEDTDVGIISAKNAGIDVIKVMID